MSATNVDPATVEVIRRALVAAAEEMMINVKRAAYSPSIHEIKDVMVGLVDRDGRILACAPGLPMFLADLGEVVHDGFEVLGRDAFRPGDIYLSNDPFTIGTHINNVATYLPIFDAEEELLGFAVARGHMVDMGGAAPGSRSLQLTEIYQEGLRLRQVRFYAEGEPVPEIHRIIGDNTRMPKAVLGDLRAQVAACRTGERRLHDIVAKYGREVFDAANHRIFDQGEAMAREAVAQMPDGDYRAEAFLDDDGVERGKHVVFPVRVIVEGERMTIDFSDFPPQTLGSINTGRSGALAIARNAFKCLTTPHEAVNEGHFRPLDLVVPPGKVVSAEPPAACGWWANTTSTVIDAIYRAVSPAMPEKVPAGHFGDIPMCLINGTDRKGERFVFFEPVPGGHGGRPHEDGVGATVAFHEGDTPDVPVEVQEATLPVLIEESAFDQDSAGAGKHRGGLGYKRVLRLLSESASAQLNVDRHECAPWGLYGGGEGKPNRAFIQREAGGEWELVLKRDGVKLSSDARIMICGGGGGGWGDPLERDSDEVLADVRAGYISTTAASELYGVAIEADAVDAEATVALRRSRGGGEEGR
ncbi:MAG TPA: hydantoinase B/oxoprolinase family protein [Solirubrobacterales bacterium]|jgi:N-methylhydantoinase B